MGTGTNHVNISLPSENVGSERSLRVKTCRLDGNLLQEPRGVLFEVMGSNSTGVKSRHAIVVVSSDNSVKLAVQMLEAFAPHLLAEQSEEPASPTFAETPIGTFLRNSATGEVVKVVEWDDRFLAWMPSEQSVAAERSDGSVMVPYQDLNPLPGWAVWEVVKAEPKKIFEVIE